MSEASWCNLDVQKYPEVTVGALIFNNDGKIFLMRSPKWRNKYVIPGGHIEIGESVDDAVKREVKEETGLDVSKIKFIAWYESVFDKDFYKKRHFIFLDFVCKTTSTDVKLNNEATDYVWVTLDEALKLPLESCTKKTIQLLKSSE